MMTSINAPRAGACRRSFAALLATLVLLSISCEKKAAQLVPESRLKLSASRRIQGYAATDTGVAVALASDGQPDTLDTRKIIRNGSLELLVYDVGQSIHKIGSIVTGVGGFVETSTQTNSGRHSASATVRVPAGNGQAEEAQYLQILKRPTTIKDTLDVTEKLSDVRGRIEQLQGEMKFLTTQIDMSTLEISLRAEGEAGVAGIHWRPLRQAKIALSEMVSGLADWADAVIAFLINLPLIVVGFLSIVALIALALRVLRFLWRRFGPRNSWRLPWKRSAPPASTAGTG